MINYSALFNEVASALLRKTVALEFNLSPPLGVDARREIGALEVPFPPQLLEMIESMGDGVEFTWQHDEYFGLCVVPSVHRLTRLFRTNRFRMERTWETLKSILPSLPEDRRKLFEGAKEYPYPFVDDPDLARETERRMNSWLPVIEFGDGDQISIDCADPSFPVILDQHDWMDGGTGANGFLMASDWEEFIRNWSRVCFQAPTWWKSVLVPDGVDWDSDEFGSEFRIA